MAVDPTVKVLLEAAEPPVAGLLDHVGDHVARFKMCIRDSPYADDTHCWWHLSEVSPELLAALADRWLETGRGLVALDLGCGLGTEIAALAHLGYRAVGVDMSPVALQRASAADSGVLFARADVTAVPLPDASVDVVLDRGCFHYLPAISRPRYVAEAKRVLKPGDVYKRQVQLSELAMLLVERCYDGREELRAIALEAAQTAGAGR